jgi:hypothetical protein
MATDFKRFFTTQNIIILLVVIALIYGFYWYSGSKRVFDSMDVMGGMAAPPAPSADKVSMNASQVSDMGLTQQTAPSPVQPVSGGYKAQPINNPSELLPQDQNSKWASLNPSATTNQVMIPDLLEAGYHIGLDTIGQTLKNPNLQIRSEPIIPKTVVSPWNNSSYEPDLARAPLEIGYGRN